MARDARHSGATAIRAAHGLRGSGDRGSAPGRRADMLRPMSAPALPAALQALLDGLVDYAGLFPPAALPLDGAAGRYAAYRVGPDRRALGRFVAPAARLDPLAERARALGATAADPWPVSALVGEAGADMDAVLPHAPAAHGRTGIVVDAVEARAASAADVARVAACVPAGVAAYVEIPHATDPTPLVRAIARAGLRAKLRTGGVTADAFPSPHEIARFLVACRDADVAFKATAGLHHPLRGDYGLTYAPDGARGTMFGFLNVFVAALLARDGADVATLEQVLVDPAPAAFTFDDAGLAWRDRRVSTARVRASRARFATSFGSCSFEEPVGEVRAVA